MRRENGRQRRPAIRAGAAVLGDRARSGRLGYSGIAHAPVPGTYSLIDVTRLAYTTVQDSGCFPHPGRELANLYPLVAAALYDVGFAMEAGPLVPWSN